MPHDCDDETLGKLRKYVSAILYRNGSARYLSKGNNNILRLPTLQRAFPNAVVLVPFRDPVEHAHSLLRQHRLFSKSGPQDAFVQSYMTWLAHHEFGATHKPFKLTDATMHHVDSNTIDYWIERWIDAYSYLLEVTKNNQGNIVFVGYELLCADSNAAWENICLKCEIPATDTTPDFHASNIDSPECEDFPQKERAIGIYQTLDGLCRAQLSLSQT